MTITRIFQLTAESRVNTDLDVLDTNNAPPSISSAQAHGGSYSYSLGSFPAAVGRPVPGYTAYRVGYWLRYSNIGQILLYTAQFGEIQFESACIQIFINTATNMLQVRRPVSGTSNSYTVITEVQIPAVMGIANQWVHYGICHKIDEVDGFLKLYVNGELVIDYTGDTRLFGQGNGTNFYSGVAGGIYVAGFYSGASLGSPAYLDDYYCDAYVGEDAAPVPARSWGVAIVNGAGANAAWTPDSGANYTMVDDNPNDGDTTKVKALTTGLKDTYTFTDVTVPPDHVIAAVIPMAFVKKLDSDTDVKIRFHAYDGSNYQDSDDLTLPMDYNNPVWARMTTQPDSTPYNETDFNAMQFGVESRGTFT